LGCGGESDEGREEQGAGSVLHGGIMAGGSFGGVAGEEGHGWFRFPRLRLVGSFLPEQDQVKKVTAGCALNWCASLHELLQDIVQVVDDYAALTQ